MPPKKSKSKKNSTTSNNIIHRSNKNKSLDYDYDPLSESKTIENEILDDKIIETEDRKIIKEEDIETENGVFGYYMSLIDLSINTRHVFQIFMLLFLTNLIYIYFIKEKEINIESKGIEKLITVSCILLTIILESFAVLNSRFRQFEKDKSKPRPQLLDFNYIYSVFFPLAIGLIKSPNYIILISSIIVQFNYMNLIVKILISYVILFQFADINLLSGKSLLLPIISSFYYEMMNKFVGNEIPIYEKTILSNLLTIGSFFIEFNNNDNNCKLSLYLMKCLYLSFIIGIILSLPILELYKNQKEKTLKYTWLIGIYLIFFSSGLIISDKLLLTKINKFHLNWLIEFIKDSNQRKEIFKNWILNSIILIPIILIIFNKFSKLINLSFKRKIWHFIIYLNLIKPILLEPELVSIALFGLLGILIIIEIIRSNELPPFGLIIKKIFIKFQDKKDNEGKFILSYIYLVLGISLPIWINNNNNLKESSYIGLILLGFGDSFASLIGSKIGKFKWPNSKKTIEGSISMVIGILIGYLILDYYLLNLKIENFQNLNWNNRIMVAVLSALFEGIIDINDNLFLPIFGYLVEELLVMFN